MYFTDALRTLLRQLPVVVIGLLLVAAACVAAFVIVPTSYQATAQVLLLPPSDPIPEGDPVNPYLNLPGSLTLTASLVAGAVATPDAQRDLVDSGFASSYATGVVPQTGPLIILTVEDTDPAAALRTRDEVLRRIADELDTIQRTEEVLDEQMILSREFGVSEDAEVLAGNRLRAMGVIFALGIVLTLLAAFSLDRWRPARRTRRTRSSPRENAEPEGQPVPVRQLVDSRDSSPRGDDDALPSKRSENEPSDAAPMMMWK